MEYQIFEMETGSPDMFSEGVNQEIAKGWTPLGGICITKGGEDWFYTQAMTRETIKIINHTEKEKK